MTLYVGDVEASRGCRIVAVGMVTPNGDTRVLVDDSAEDRGTVLELASHIYNALTEEV